MRPPNCCTDLHKAFQSTADAQHAAGDGKLGYCSYAEGEAANQRGDGRELHGGACDCSCIWTGEGRDTKELSLAQRWGTKAAATKMQQQQMQK
jgi:hypothetical protein